MEIERGGGTGFCLSHSKHPSNRVRAGTSSSLERLLYFYYHIFLGSLYFTLFDVLFPIL